MLKNCVNCKKELNANQKKFCSRSCSVTTNNLGRCRNGKPSPNCLLCGEKLNKSSKKFCSYKCTKQYQYENWIEEWKQGKHKGWSGNTCQISEPIRRYLFEKFNRKCCKCGWNKVNLHTGNIPLEINHIDGDAKNNNEKNLELVCPNCHSLTENFRALNKSSARSRKTNKSCYEDSNLGHLITSER